MKKRDLNHEIFKRLIINLTSVAIKSLVIIYLNTFQNFFCTNTYL